MSQPHKKIALILSSFIVAGLLLTGAAVVLAATSFSLVGTLVFADPVYTVNSQVITVTETTACTDLGGITVDPCSGLAGKLVEATGIYTSTAYTATAITELGTYTGVLTAIEGNTWTVGGKQFEVSAELALGFAVRDVVMLTYKNAAGTFVALDVEAVATSTFVGKVIAMGGTWQVNGETFTVNGDTAIYADAKVKDIVEVTYYGTNIAVDIALYPTTTVNARVIQVDPWMIEGLAGLTTNDWTDAYEGAVPGDIATVVYYEYEGVIIASEITLYAPIKNENSRCEDWQTADFRIPPGIEKQLPPGADLAQVYAMFCQGFGWGEIKNAFKLSNPEYTPEELMAMKATGKGWGQLKKELDLKPEKVNNGKGNEIEVTDKPGKPDEVGKPDKPEKPDKPDNANKPENPGNSNKDKDKNNNGNANGKNK